MSDDDLDWLYEVVEAKVIAEMNLEEEEDE